MRLENEPASSGTPGSEGVANEEQRAYWNGEEAEHWLQYEDRYEEMLRPYTRRLSTSSGSTRPRSSLMSAAGAVRRRGRPLDP